jgi:hypothetical protein
MRASSLASVDGQVGVQVMEGLLAAMAGESSVRPRPMLLPSGVTVAAGESCRGSL